MQLPHGETRKSASQPESNLQVALEELL